MDEKNVNKYHFSNLKQKQEKGLTWKVLTLNELARYVFAT